MSTTWSKIQDARIYQGDTVAEQYQLRNEMTEASPATTLATVEVLVKNALADADNAAILTRRSDGVDATNKIVIDDAAAWKFTIKATATATAALTPGIYRWICTTIDSAGNRGTGFTGQFEIVRRGSDPST